MKRTANECFGVICFLLLHMRGNFPETKTVLCAALLAQTTRLTARIPQPI